MTKKEQDTFDLASIGGRFNRYIKSKGLSGREAAELLDKSPSLISQMVSGTRFSAEVLAKIIEVFPDLNLDWLLNDQGEMEFYQQKINSDYRTELARLQREFKRIEGLQKAMTSLQAKERVEGLNTLVEEVLILRLRIISEGFDIYKVVAKL